MPVPTRLVHQWIVGDKEYRLTEEAELKLAPARYIEMKIKDSLGDVCWSLIWDSGSNASEASRILAEAVSQFARWTHGGKLRATPVPETK